MSILELKKRLEENEVTSVELVQKAIEMHERWIDKNAIGVLSPQALLVASHRDQERKEGKIRGTLHGIPLVIKDNILYRDGTPTTANAFSLHDLIPPYDAFIVQRLMDAGAIILGKANLSEFAYFMSYDDMPSGYGSMYGQVKHPFDEKIDPYGSSTGSAVAVKLGIVDISIGTETNGSLMAPAYQTQIVSFKPSFGYVSKKGIIPISPTQDTAGPMALTVSDCALLMDVLAQEDQHDPSTLGLKRPHSFYDGIDNKLAPSKIGLITFKDKPYTKGNLEVVEKATKKLESLGHQVIPIEIDVPELSNDPTLLVEFKYAINQFLNEVKGSTNMTSLSDIITFNQANERRCLRYGQSILTKANETSGDLTDPDYLSIRKELFGKASLLEEIMKEKDLIAVMTPFWMGFAPIYGNPSICIPEGIIDDIPKAIVFVGRKYDDKVLLRLAHLYHIQK
ncbi:MAG: amidase family protein [Acholeplasmataceae bacterium]|jgi:amidase|nr:amidase family protein [Acholeplasmataceae bacterium]